MHAHTHDLAILTVAAFNSDCIKHDTLYTAICDRLIGKCLWERTILQHFDKHSNQSHCSKIKWYWSQFPLSLQVNHKFLLNSMFRRVSWRPETLLALDEVWYSRRQLEASKRGWLESGSRLKGIGYLDKQYIVNHLGCAVLVTIATTLPRCLCTRSLIELYSAAKADTVLPPKS